MAHKDIFAIIKLGGAAITDKSKESTMRSEIIKNSIKEIKESKIPSIIIHGAGSFAHNLAKKYRLAFGLDSSINIQEQIRGVTLTRRSLQTLHNAILDAGLEYHLNLFSIPISSILVSNGAGNEYSIYFDSIQAALDNEFVPILYGDISFDTQSSFRVISGDRIIQLLCEAILTDNIIIHQKQIKVIFGSNVDGIFDKDPKFSDSQLLEEIYNNQLETVIQNSGASAGIDITGGMKGKLEEIKKISDLGVQVEIVNITKNNRLKARLLGEDVIHTVIHPYK